MKQNFNVMLEEEKNHNKIDNSSEETKMEIINGIEFFYNNNESTIKCKADAKEMADGTRKSDRIMAKIGIINSLNDSAKNRFL